MPDIETFFAEWMSDAFAHDPNLASSLGLSQYDGEMGDFSAEAFARRSASDRQWAARIESVDMTSLDNDQQVDVALLASHLAGRAVLDEWAQWRRDPDTYLDPCLWGVFNLFVHRLRPEPELVAAAVSRLRQIPDVLAAATANLAPELANPLILQRAAAAAHGGVGFLRDNLPTEVADPGLRADLADAGERASVSLATFADHLVDLAKRSGGSWEFGEGRYDAILRQRELLGIGAGALAERAEIEWSALDQDLRSLAARVDPDADGWRPVLHRLSADHPGSAEEMRRGYVDACDRARDFLVERQLVTLPAGEQCAIVPSPPFLRPVLAVASYLQPPPFSASRRGHFFVPWPAEGMTEADLTDRLRDNGWHAIPTIAVHEAYPGHHWQMTVAADCPRPLRKVITTSYFVEGWALYAEGMVRRQGFFDDPRQELCHLEARIFRAARIVIDTALHSGTMSVETAVSELVGRTGLTESVARAEVLRYCAWPTQAASYLTGALEIERLARRWEDENRGDLRHFHDAVASSPGLPIPLTERAVFGPA
jgi:uncharacterized protein (DUF885 family)